MNGGGGSVWEGSCDAGSGGFRLQGGDSRVFALWTRDAAAADRTTLSCGGGGRRWQALGSGGDQQGEHSGKDAENHDGTTLGGVVRSD